MPRSIKIIFSSCLSGILIGIGAIIFLALKEANIYLGSMLFAVGLTTIILTGQYLYTGKVGYIFDNKPNYLLDLLICYIGNIIGAVLCGYVIRLTRLNNVITASNEVANLKINDGFLSLFVLAIFCGMMIYLAVEMNKRSFHPVVQYASVFICIMVFILAGFEHSIADMVYFSIANMWNWSSIWRILIISLGNGIGSLILYFLFKLAKVKTNE